MKNTGLPYLDMIEVKHRDKAYKLQVLESRRKDKAIWKSFSNRNTRIDTSNLEAIEDRLTIL